MLPHQEIDLRHPATNHKNAGFTDEERGKMSELLADGFLDTFRYLYPDQTDAYTWWSYMNHARQNNAGWRIDYFLTSKRMKEQLIDHKIHTEVMGSDHCPIELDLKE
jgi:exodeoxyribonuclease-3